MQIKIEINEHDLKKLVIDFLERKTGQEIDKANVKIMVKSKQNYRSEWEQAEFKAVYEKFEV